MVYTERVPGAELRPWVRSLWYCRAPRMAHAWERVLPDGCMQLLVNLAGETLTDCGAGGLGDRRMAGVVMMGAKTHCEMVATCDMEEIAGAVVEPGGFGRMFRERADALEGRGVALDDLWEGAGQRMAERLREGVHAQEKLALLECLLCERVRGGMERSWLVDAALERMGRPGMTVRQCAREVGVSERRLLAVFREEVGLGPKAWMRVLRFQTAVRALHRGVDVRWAELAIDCGYYDQSHFANEFREFSGVDPTTYTAARGVWRNHVPILPRRA